MIGCVPSGSNSFGTAFVQGRNRVPRPATGRIACEIFIEIFERKQPLVYEN
jgi:hypothetical protein